MQDPIDKLAFLYLKEGKVLVALSHGKDKWYIPGGKREPDESDRDALIREVKEELNVKLIPETLKYYGTFKTQAHGKPEGTFVQMICYTGEFKGQLKASSEIEKIDFFTYEQKELMTPVAHLIFDHLHAKKLLL